MDKKDYWEVRRDGVPLAGGPKSTMPDAKQRKVCVRVAARSTWKVNYSGRANNEFYSRRQSYRQDNASP